MLWICRDNLSHTHARTFYEDRFHKYCGSERLVIHSCRIQLWGCSGGARAVSADVALGRSVIDFPLYSLFIHHLWAILNELDACGLHCGLSRISFGHFYNDSLQCGFYQSSGSAVEGNVKCPGRGCDQLAIVNAQSHVLSSAAATNFHPVSLQRGFCQLIGSQHATFNRRPHVFPSGVKTILYPDGLQYALCSSEHTIISRSILLQSLSAAAIHYPDNSITVNPGFFGIKCSFYGSSEHWVTLKCIASDLVKSTVCVVVSKRKPGRCYLDTYIESWLQFNHSCCVARLGCI